MTHAFDALFDRIGNRRQFHHALGAFAGVALASRFHGPAPHAVRHTPSYPFTLGVASGDPWPHGFVAWTRLAPAGGLPYRPVNVDWQVATDPRMNRIVHAGAAQARPELAHAVHVEVTGLAPGGDYYYRFRAAGELSEVGRARTTSPWARRLRFAFASCQRRAPTGRYAAFAAMAEDDLDLVIHLGDYVYERPSTRTLADYRDLYALYKGSPDLRAMHGRAPFVVTFDDHELTNNYAGGGQADPRFLRRRAAAYRAYFEHMPLPVSALPVGAGMRLHRRISYGGLAMFHVLDTRQYRSPQPCGGVLSACPERYNPAQTMLGTAQLRWLAEGLAASPARWNILAQQTMMADFRYGSRYSTDTWAGYAYERTNLLRYVRDRHVSGPVVITGDSHCGFVNDLWDADRPVASELVGPSISSDCGSYARIAAHLASNPTCRYSTGNLRGYVRCDVTADRLNARYVTLAGGPAAIGAEFTVRRGRPFAERTQ